MDFEKQVNSLIKQVNLLVKQVEELKSENAALRAENTALRAENAALKAEIGELRTENSMLKAENEKLRAEIVRLKKGLNSRNSSIPPSKGLKRTTKKRSLRKQTGKHVGGQKGHKGHNLKMRKNPDNVIKHSIDKCIHCGDELISTPGKIGLRGQIFDIPAIQIEVTEHQQIVKRCSCCGHENKPELPGTLSYSKTQYGVNLRFLLSYLSAYQYISVDRIKSMIQTLTGHQLSTGFIQNCIQYTADHLQHAYDTILEYIKRSKVAGSDETGCRIAGKRRWFWIWATDRYRFITASINRGYETIKNVLGEKMQTFILVSDCWSAQLKTKTTEKQICLVHLMRDCNKLIDHYSSQWAKQMKRLLEKIISLSRDFDSSEEFKAEKQELEQKLDRLLDQKLQRSADKIKTLRNRLRKNRQYITTCLEYKEVPAHNNLSEQGVRNIKVKEKVSTGFRTMKGAENYAIIRSVIETANLQGINPFDAMQVPEILFISPVSPE